MRTVITGLAIALLSILAYRDVHAQDATEVLEARIALLEAQLAAATLEIKLCTDPTITESRQRVLNAQKVYEQKVAAQKAAAQKAEQATSK